MEKFKELNLLLYKYKCLIDFEDNLQKNNFKFVNNYLKYQQKKNEGWIDDCLDFLKDAVDLQENMLKNIALYRSL